MTKKEQINNIMENEGKSYSTARYILARGENYKPRPRQAIIYKDLVDLGLEVKIDVYNETGYAVYQNFKRRPIGLRKTNQYKYGGQKFHYYTYYTYKDENGNLKQRPIALAAIVWCLLLHKDIPAGYVIDHIDNDSFNNRLDNLQMITIGENVKKDAKGHNQYKIN